MVRELCRTILNVHSICFWLDIPGTILRFSPLCPRLFYASPLLSPVFPGIALFPCVRSYAAVCPVPINRNATKNERQRERRRGREATYNPFDKRLLIVFPSDRIASTAPSRFYRRRVSRPIIFQMCPMNRQKYGY